MTLKENPTYYRLTRSQDHGADTLYLLLVVFPGLLMAVSGDIGQAFGMLWSGAAHYLYISVRAMFDSLKTVSKDIEGRALGELLSSGISGRQVVWAHLVAGIQRRRLAFVFTPLVALIFSGYLGWSGFFMILVLSAVLVPLYTALGIVLATHCQTSAKAQRLALAVVGMHYFGSLLLSWFSASAAAGANPIFASLTLLEEIGGPVEGHAMYASIGLHLLLGLAAWGWAVVTLGEPDGQPARPPRTVVTRSRGFRFENPILSRELRFEPPWICLLLLLGPMLACGFDDGEGLAYGLSALAAYLCLRAVSGAQASLDSEKHGRTLDTLLSTPLSSREIVLAKAAAVLLPLWAIEALLLPLVLLINQPFTGIIEGTAVLLTLAAVLAVLTCLQLAFSTMGVSGWGWLLGLMFLPLVAAPFEVSANVIGLAQPLVAMAAVASKPALALLYIPVFLGVAAAALRQACLRLR